MPPVGIAQGTGDDPGVRAAERVLGQRHLVLVGLMGAGKSAIGRRLAGVFGRPFTDSDTVVEKAAGQTIADIFASDGEESFRKMEEGAIRHLLEGAPAVIATGGGAFMRSANRARIRRSALSVWLRAELDVLVARIRRPASRPLLAGDNLHGTLARLIRERHPVYAGADVTVDSEAINHAAMVRRTLAAIAAADA